MEGLPKQNTAEIDPSKSSLLEGGLDLEKGPFVDTPSIYNGPLSKAEVYRDKRTGEEFFPINDNKRPEFQRFISYILKGIINTADIVKYDGKYFSHRQKLEHVEKGDDSFMEEVKADIFILKNIFGDYDHGYYEHYDLGFHNFLEQKNMTENEAFNMDLEHRNLVINKADKNSYFFDLDSSGYIGLGKGEGFHSLQVQTDGDKSEYKKFLISSIYAPEQSFKVKTVKILKDKVDSLIKTIFSKEKYDVFEKVVDKSGTRFHETTFSFYRFHSDTAEDMKKEIFADLCVRCEIMKEVMEEILQAQNN